MENKDSTMRVDNINTKEELWQRADLAETASKSTAKSAASSKGTNSQSISINANELTLTSDPISEKRKKAQKQAMKLIEDAFTSEKKVDADLDERRAHIKDLQAEKLQANKDIKELEAEREELRKQYGVPEDSEEQEELKLLEKESQAKLKAPHANLTKEEYEKLAKIHAKGLTEYQQRSMERYDSEIGKKNAIYDMDEEVKFENQVISTTKIERLKTHTLEDAEKQAENLMDATNKEIFSMIVDEAKEHIDEKQQEEKDKAEARKEKQEELEARLDVAKERREKEEELTEDILEGYQQIQGSSSDLDSAKQEIKNMMSKLGLIEDDLKGAVVNENL